MNKNNKVKIAEIVNAFRLINSDIRKSFEIMSEILNNKKGLIEWKKWEKGSKNAKEDYQDYTNFFEGNSWYYLSNYGKYNDYVIGFTFVVSVEQDDEEAYVEFIEHLDGALNSNSPMLCIFGVYEPIDVDNIMLLQDDYVYVDDLLQFTDNCKDFNLNDIEYNKWIEIITIDSTPSGWYKNAHTKIVSIADFSSKKVLACEIDELIDKANSKKT